MVSHDGLWCLMVSHSVSWYLMMSHSVSWCLMVSHGVMHQQSVCMDPEPQKYRDGIFHFYKETATYTISMSNQQSTAPLNKKKGRPTCRCYAKSPNCVGRVLANTKPDQLHLGDWPKEKETAYCLLLPKIMQDNDCIDLETTWAVFIFSIKVFLIPLRAYTAQQPWYML